MNGGGILLKQSTKRGSNIRVYDALFPVDGFIEGELKDWPAKVQDYILTAVERVAKTVRLPLSIVHSECRVDHGEKEDGSDDRFNLYIIVSEVVAGADTIIRDQMIQEALAASFDPGKSVH